MNEIPAVRRENVQTNERELRSRGERIVARSFYRELRENGYSPRELLAVSSELIDLVVGALWNRLLITRAPMRDSMPRELVQMVLNGVRPR